MLIPELPLLFAVQPLIVALLALDAVGGVTAAVQPRMVLAAPALMPMPVFVLAVHSVTRLLRADDDAIGPAGGNRAMGDEAFCADVNAGRRR